jgi:hypothetical protein
MRQNLNPLKTEENLKNRGFESVGTNDPGKIQENNMEIMRAKKNWLVA